MKKIIKNKVYDTDTAQLIGGVVTDQYSSQDPEYYYETLYVKKTGEFFIHGVGGAKSRYAVRRDGSWVEGEALVPLSFDSARDFVEEHLDRDTFDKFFGTSDISNTNTVSFKTTLSSEAKNLLERERAKSGTPISTLLDEIIKKSLKKDP